MGLGPEDIRVLRQIRGNQTGGTCAILGHCTFWYDHGSLQHFKDMMKFDLVETFDINGTPTHTVDLQEPLPENFCNKYDFVIDVGTLYSVFDTCSLFENIVRMLKIGGSVFHITNLIGYFGRGYWSVSPSVLYEFYSCNGFDVKRMGHYINAPNCRQWVDFDPTAHCLLAATATSLQFYHSGSVRGAVPNDTSLMCLVTKREFVEKIHKPVPRHYIRTNGA